jgi:hypothetical protein
MFAMHGHKNLKQSRVVSGLLTGQYTLRRHLYIMGLVGSPLIRRCGAKEKTSFSFSVKLYRHSDILTWAPFP